MNSTKRAAHRAGALYFVFMIFGIVGEFLFPNFMVPEDAAATAHNITAASLVYRISILTDFASLILFIFLVVSLYRLLRDFDKSQAMLMVLLVTVGVAVTIGNLLSRFVPLMLLDGAAYLSVFTKPQLNALILTFLRIDRSGGAVSTVFWGLWLFPFGILVIKSRLFPRILGILLLIAGFAYLASGVTSIVLPEYRQMVGRIMMPLYFGEVPIILWLLIMGARVPHSQVKPSGAI